MKKISMHIGSVFEGQGLFELEQLRRAKLLAMHLLAIRGRNDVSHLLAELPWFIPALQTFEEHLQRHGFENGLDAIGQANEQAHRATVDISDWHNWGEHVNNTSVCMCWYRKGARGRDWFFHVVFDVEPNFSKPPHQVIFFNSLDSSGSHLTPSCLKQATA